MLNNCKRYLLTHMYQIFTKEARNATATPVSVEVLNKKMMGQIETGKDKMQLAVYNNRVWGPALSLTCN